MADTPPGRSQADSLTPPRSRSGETNLYNLEEAECCNVNNCGYDLAGDMLRTFFGEKVRAVRKEARQRNGKEQALVSNLGGLVLGCIEGDFRK